MFEPTTDRQTDRWTDSSTAICHPTACVCVGGVCRQSKMTKSDIADQQGLWFIKEIIATVHHVSMYISPQVSNETNHSQISTGKK